MALLAPPRHHFGVLLEQKPCKISGLRYLASYWCHFCSRSGLRGASWHHFGRFLKQGPCKISDLRYLAVPFLTCFCCFGSVRDAFVMHLFCTFVVANSLFWPAVVLLVAALRRLASFAFRCGSVPRIGWPKCPPPDGPTVMPPLGSFLERHARRLVLLFGAKQKRYKDRS